MKKVLIISYYWPPSGGAGVQRWLKLSKYLAKSNVEVHILTVDPKKASYTSIDNSLTQDIHPKIIVHYSDSFEIINYYSKLAGKKNVPTAGFSNVNNSSVIQKAVNALRSNLFIPDPRKGWKKYAVKKAIEIIKEYSIHSIITTSPPHSTQLIGLELKKRLSINWIVDFRDPWTDIYYYKLLRHTAISAKIDQKLEKKVIEQSDRIITVSNGFKSIFLNKTEKVKEEKFSVIPNGFDPDDFKEKSKTQSSIEQFIICYTGTMSMQYNPFIFFDALNDCKKDNILLQIVGTTSAKIKKYIEQLKLNVEYVETVPHEQVSKIQQQSDLLLLVIPDVKLSEGITPGKLFEYMASGNQTIALGPENSDVNQILKECNAGKTFDRNDKSKITDYIFNLITRKVESNYPKIDSVALSHYSRKNQAEQIRQLL